MNMLKPKQKKFIIKNDIDQIYMFLEISGEKLKMLKNFLLRFIYSRRFMK